ncbi:MAG: DUF551 domain-containing protein [Kiritimatiellae bacterium]|nr:DUF551 domain-containing protein [Kiritimatiellia bacterium]
MARYIDADVLSDAVIQSKNNNRHSDTVLRLSHDNEHRHFLAMIDAAPTADVSPDTKWISVKERLPEVEADILAYIGEGGFVVCWMTHDGYWQCPAYLMDKDDVTHWQPLPEPPKEEGENA